MLGVTFSYVRCQKVFYNFIFKIMSRLDAATNHTKTCHHMKNSKSLVLSLVFARYTKFRTYGIQLESLPVF